MANVSFSGPPQASLLSPAYQKMTLASNYLDIQNNGWTQQYLPELYEQEVDRYGNRTISGFLAMLSAEMPLQSDQVIWSEQGRLHLAYKATINCTTGAVTSIKNIDDNNLAEAHAVRKGATVVASITGAGGTKVCKAIVEEGIETSTTALKLRPYGAQNFDDLATLTGSDTAVAINFFVYGSEFDKGTDTMQNSIEPTFKTLKSVAIAVGLVDYVNSLTWKSQGNGIYAMRKKS